MLNILQQDIPFCHDMLCLKTMITLHLLTSADFQLSFLKQTNNAHNINLIHEKKNASALIYQAMLAVQHCTT